MNRHQASWQALAWLACMLATPATDAADAPAPAAADATVQGDAAKPAAPAGSAAASSVTGGASASAESVAARDCSDEARLARKRMALGIEETTFMQDRAHELKEIALSWIPGYKVYATVRDTKAAVERVQIAAEYVDPCDARPAAATASADGVQEGESEPPAQDSKWLEAVKGALPGR